jgi:hypothetical protein
MVGMVFSGHVAVRPDVVVSSDDRNMARILLIWITVLDPIMQDEVMLLVKRDVLFPEEYRTSLCDQQGQLVFLSVTELTELDANQFGTDIWRQMSNLLRCGEQGLLLGVRKESTIFRRFKLLDRGVWCSVSKHLLGDPSMREAHCESSDWFEFAANEIKIMED